MVNVVLGQQRVFGGKVLCVTHPTSLRLDFSGALYYCTMGRFGNTRGVTTATDQAAVLDRLAVKRTGSDLLIIRVISLFGSCMVAMASSKPLTPPTEHLRSTEGKNRKSPLVCHRCVTLTCHLFTYGCTETKTGALINSVSGALSGLSIFKSLL